MKIRLSHALSSLTLSMSVVACGGAPIDGNTASTSQSLSICGASCNPITPPVKPPTASVITITSDQLQQTVQLLLTGSALAVDTTEQGKPDFGEQITVPNEARVACFEDGDAACDKQYSLQLERLACTRRVTAQCSPLPTTITTAQEYWTYFKFSPLAQSFGAKDVLYDLVPIHHESLLTSFDIGINQVYAELTLENVTAGFSAGATPGGPPSIWLGLTDIESQSPTVLISADWPDVDLSNMQASVTLSGVAPTADGQSVDFTDVASTFTCGWKTVGFPSGFAGLFYDVEGKVASHVESRVNGAFEKPNTHAALSSALGALIKKEIEKVNPAGYASLVSVTYVDPGAWTISYWPN